MSMIDPIVGTTSSVTGTSSSVGSPTATRTPKQEMDGELFLQLLVTQLRAQDPSSPLDTNAMIAQTSQLATVEQLTTIAEAQDVSFGVQLRAAAAQLLGREITYTDASGATRTGAATGVSFQGTVPLITIGADKVRFDSIVSVGAPATASESAAGASTSDSTTA
jgi:flagellar basal-body rod modification protein FlgD